jgi:hypothetical protein
MESCNDVIEIEEYTEEDHVYNASCYESNLFDCNDVNRHYLTISSIYIQYPFFKYCGHDLLPCILQSQLQHEIGMKTCILKRFILE